MEEDEDSSISEYDVCFVAKVARSKEVHCRKLFCCSYEELPTAIRNMVINSHGKCISGTILSIYDTFNSEYIINPEMIEI